MPVITCEHCADEIYRSSEPEARRALDQHQKRCGVAKRARAAEKRPRA